MSDEITIRVWDDNHKELVASDAMEFKAEGERIGSKNVLYVPKSKLNKAEKNIEEKNQIIDDWYKKSLRQSEIITDLKEGLKRLRKINQKLRNEAKRA